MAAAAASFQYIDRLNIAGAKESLRILSADWSGNGYPSTTIRVIGSGPVRKYPDPDAGTSGSARSTTVLNDGDAWYPAL